MSANGFVPHEVHLVGSFPLQSNTATFTLASTILGQHLRRLPDGETGERMGWIRWQGEIIRAMAQLEQGTVEGGIGGTYGNYMLYQLRPGVTTDDIQFPSLGYSAAAIASYAEFIRLKDEGIIPSHVRFEACLPTPLAPTFMLIVPQHQPAVEAAYEARMLIELDEILAAIPAHDLAIQWDTAVEFAVLEGMIVTHLVDVEVEILTRLVRLGNHVPVDVELGFHLCYGAAGNRHFKEPEDMSKLVSIANGIAAGLDRPLTWIHMPVPRDRTDDAYYAPLRQLRLASETKLYLGLVHLTDGVAGAEQRIKAAHAAIPHIDFGVATVCGLGPSPAENIPELLQIHAAISAPVR